jgi:hypothetical protein
MDAPLDATHAERHPGRTQTILALGVALAAASGATLAGPNGWAAPKHHAGTRQTAQPSGTQATDALNAPLSPTLGKNAAATPDPTVDPDNPPAPPPPDGYQVVRDEDVTAQSFSSKVTATGGPGLPSIEARQTPRNANDVPSHVSVFGVPVKFDAPVTPPYNASFMYSTYAGQPGRGIDAVGAEGAAGQP